MKGIFKYPFRADLVSWVQMTFSMMYSPDKMMTGKSPLPMSTPGSCFPSRYSPTYRTPSDSMRRCITNPPVSHWSICLCYYLTSVAIRLQKKKLHTLVYYNFIFSRNRLQEVVGSALLSILPFLYSWISRCNPNPLD